VAKGFREKSAQYKAVVKNRRALRARGLGRFEVRGLDSDKALIRQIAKKLADGDAAAAALREELSGKLAPPPKVTNIWAWLRASPLAGVDWYVEREFEPGRDVDL